MNSLSSTVNSLEWRRSKVLELSSQGCSQPEIAMILQISQPTVNRDIWLSKRASQTKPTKSYSRQTPRGVSKLYDRNKPSVKDMLGDC
jgi:predicted transcriptional regulator